MLLLCSVAVRSFANGPCPALIAKPVFRAGSNGRKKRDVQPDCMKSAELVFITNVLHPAKDN